MILGSEPRVNLQILAAALDQLPDLLESGSLTQGLVVTAAGQTYRPSLSIGLVLDLLRDLERPASGLDAEDRARLAGLQGRFEATRRVFAAAYGRHLARELKSAVDRWSYFLDEVGHGEPGAREAYPSQIRDRSRIALLLAEAEAQAIEVGAQRERLAALDQRLERLTHPGPYLGPPDQAADFPESRYPWLYRAP